MKKKRFIYLLLALTWLAPLVAQPVSAAPAPNSPARTSSSGLGSPAWLSVQPKTWTAPQPAASLAPTRQLRQQSYDDMSPDFDRDGIPNTQEVNGWYNNRGGPYYTDPEDPDSDDDGLTDGEEQLFNTDPTDKSMPGLYVVYNDTLQTKKYWPWVQYGQKRISYTTVGAASKVVVRRGTTFEVGGRFSDPNMVVQLLDADGVGLDLGKISISELDPCTGRVQVSVASDSDVGHYRLRLRTNNWSWFKVIEIYVVFELPDDMTETEIDAYLYDDDAITQRKDEVAIWIDTDEVITGTNDYTAQSFALRFDTLHYQEWFFEDWVLPAFNGLDNQWDAATALRLKVDDDTVFGHPRPLFDSWNTLHPPGGDDRNQCSNIANLLAAYARTTGIPSRPIMTDWRHSTFDHATEFWLHGSSGQQSGDWWVARGYGDSGAPEDRYYWGYGPWYSGNGSSDMVVVGGAAWVWDETSGSGEPETYDYEYHAKGPLPDVSPSHQIIRQDWWETVATIYWGRWIDSDWGWGDPATEPVDVGDLPQGTRVQLPERIIETAPASPDSAPVTLGQVVADYGVDQDQDGRFDQLVVETTVQVEQPGTYWLYALLGSHQRSPAMVGTGGEVASAVVELDLGAGKHVVQIPFEGLEIFGRQVDGPYHIINMWITDLQTDDREKMMARAFDSFQDQGGTYDTAAYRQAAFEAPLAELSGRYHELDLTNSRAQGDTLIINADLNIYTPGRYTLTGELYDRQDNFVAKASWTGAAGPAALRFDGLNNADAPYTLKYLRLFDDQGTMLDSAYTAHTAEMASPARVASPESVSLSRGDGITPTDVYAETLIDLDGDGLYDRLDIEVQVEVSEAGSYRVEGWLVDRYDHLTALGLGDPITVSTGIYTLTLPFDGRQLYGQGTYSYTLVALKVIEGYTYTVRDEIEVAHTTADYDRTQFEPPTTGRIAFEDDVESGDGQWTAQSPWDITSATYRSPEHAWTDSPGSDYANDADTSLAIASALDLSQLADPALSFQTCHALESGDEGLVQVSDNGGASWTTVETYTGDSAHWLADMVDLSAYAGADSLQVRFRLSADASDVADGWYLDDAYLTGWPLPTEAAFSFPSDPLLTADPIDFVATFTPTDAMAPITYTWNFGDGSPLGETTSPTYTHDFDEPGDYTVWLTVSNPYGDAVYSYTLTVYQPLLDVNYTRTPTGEVSLLETVYFTATYSPADTSPPVTYTWNFSGTQVGPTTISTTNYAFTDSDGPHPVWLTATNGYGTDTYQEYIGVGCTALTALSYTYEPAEPDLGQVVTFTADYEPSAISTVTFTWDFGDGYVTETTALSVTHSFSSGDDYLVNLRADTDGCGYRETEQTVTIHQEVLTSSFTYDPVPPLADQDVTFVASYGPDTAYQPVTYTWNFGDGYTMVSDVPTVTYNFDTAGDYTVWVTATNADGFVPYSMTLFVAQPLLAVEYTFTPDPPDLTGVVTFTAHPSPGDTTLPVTYTWDFDDGSPNLVTTTKTVQHTFVGGKYNVQLAATNDHGSANYQDNVLIPVAIDDVSFTYTLPITYAEQATLVAHPTPTNATRPIYYTWDFGDGLTTTVNVPTVTHAFIDDGDLTVLLTATNGYGTAYASDTVPVNGQPVKSAFFDYDPAPAVAYEATTFIGYVGPIEATPPVYHIWNFGEGPTTPSLDGITYYTFTNPGLHTVWLTATNDYGNAVYSGTVNVLSHQPGWQKQIWVNDTGPYDPDHALRDLVAGDAVTITDRISVAYTTEPFTFTLTEAWGTWLNLTDVFTTAGTVNQGVQMVTWQVTDGTPDVTYAITKAFEIADDDWTMTTLTESLSADGAIPEVDDIVLQFYHAGVCVPVSSVDLTLVTATPIYTTTNVQFNADILPNGFDTPYTYTIDYGSGPSAPTSSNDDPLTTPLDHTFASTGTYDVEIAAWNCDMTEPVTDSLSVQVSASQAVCTDMSIDDLQSDSPVNLGQGMHFAATVSGDAPITYNWDFGGPGSGSNTDGSTPVYTYTAEGTFTVTLDVENSCPSSDTESIQVTVNPAGTCINVAGADFDVTPARPIAGQAVTFGGSVTAGDEPITYDWDFGGLASDSGQVVNYTFPATYTKQTYTVTMTATNTCPSSQQVVEAITVWPHTIYLPLVLKGQ